MNCKSFISVLLIGLLIFGGPQDILANTGNSPDDCTGTVSECVNKNEGAPAEKGNTEVAPEPASETTTFGTMLKVLFALVLVVGLMVLVLKLLHKRTQVVQQGRGIQTLGGAMLGNQRSIQLVKIGDRILVVGVGDNVELIKEIEDEREIESLVANQDSPAYSTEKIQGAAGWVKTLWGNRNQSNKTNFQHILKKQLDDSKQNRNELMESLKKKGHDND